MHSKGEQSSNRLLLSGLSFLYSPFPFPNWLQGPVGLCLHPAAQSPRFLEMEDLGLKLTQITERGSHGKPTERHREEDSAGQFIWKSGQRRDF